MQVGTGRNKADKTYSRVFNDPHKVNLIAPSLPTLERLSLPLHWESGPEFSKLIALIAILERIHDEDRSRGIGIQTGDVETGCLVMPSVAKFDGTPLAGGLHRVGPCGKKILIGASVHIDLATALQWCHNNAELEQRANGPGYLTFFVVSNNGALYTLVRTARRHNGTNTRRQVGC